MNDAVAETVLPTEDETARLGVWFGERLRAGDCLLLEGPIGAGKSHLARALIRARLHTPEDVPSPTFTLVQTYHADVDIWHADLYRLSHPDEVAELGLEDAFASAITVVEWPDRLGSRLPESAIRLSLAEHQGGRSARLHAPRHPALMQDFRRDWCADV